MESNRSCLTRCVAWACAAVALLAALSAAALGYAGRWLLLPQHPVAADAIIVLAGPFERSIYAADLYHQRYASKIYLSVAAPDAGALKVEALGIPLPRDFDVHRQVLIRKGVPPGDILSFGRGSLSTAEEAEVLRQLFGQARVGLLVVTSPYHARRAKLTLERAFAGSGVNVTVVATPYEEFRVDWWRSQDAARNVLLELAKIAYYLVGGRFSAAL